jgi:hypothetical protein
VKGPNGAASTPPKRAGLLPGQVRILAALATAKGPLNRKQIFKEEEMAKGWLSDYLGLLDPQKQPDREVRTGIRSLPPVRFIRFKSIDVHGDDSRFENCYVITGTGREALAATQK